MTDRLPRIVLHIGCHKTGSTSIQDFAYQDKERLPAAGIYYPGGLFKDFPEQHSRLNDLLEARDAAAVEAVFAQIVHGAVEAGAHTVLLSGEDLCAANPNGVRLLAEIADKYFVEKSFVIVVRNPRDYALSQFKHHMRYAAPLTEVGFLNQKPISGRRSIENWTRNFSSGTTLIYDQIADDLAPKFFDAIFGVKIEDRRRSNVSQDFLTLSIHNVFLKEWLSPAIDRIHWNVALRHPTRMKFAIEDLLARDLSQPSDEDWEIVGPPPPPAPPPVSFAGGGHDPVAVCDKMLTMFSMLKEHFVRQQELALAKNEGKGEAGR